MADPKSNFWHETSNSYEFFTPKSRWYLCILNQMKNLSNYKVWNNLELLFYCGDFQRKWWLFRSQKRQTHCTKRSLVSSAALAVFWELFCRFLWILSTHLLLSLPPLFFLCCSELAFFRISSYNLGRRAERALFGQNFSFFAFQRRKRKKKVGRRERLCIDNYDLEKEMMMTINQKVWCSEQKLTLLPSQTTKKRTI